MMVRLDKPHERKVRAIVSMHKRTFGRHKSYTEVANELIRDGLAANGQFVIPIKRNGK